MGVAKITISIDEQLLKRLDVSVRSRVFPSRSQAVQSAVQEKIARIGKTRLAQECVKLDPNEEQALADEGSMMSFSELNEAYRQMAQDERREAEALEWAEATSKDTANEPQTG